jgi:4-amino-4-deoxy-L-arabinose transferase-like glycosyltransferase
VIETRHGPTRYTLFTWAIIGLWFVLTMATLSYNGPFFDEATQITAGLRTLEGHGYSDQYLVWFGGSLAWPILGGLGYKIAGLTGTRIVSTILCTIAFVALVKAARNLFGDGAALWTAVAFALNGPFGALARLGVYDSLALPCIAVSFWAITELKRRDHRLWLLVAAVAFTLGTIAKYPIGLMLLPLLGVLIILRRQKSVMDIFISGFISGAIALSYFLPAREQLALAPAWQFANKPRFGVTTEMIAFAFFYMGAAPSLFALHGWFVARDQRALSTALLSSLAIWPLFHLSSGNPVSTNKHVVFSFLFVYPLVGLSLSTMWKAAAGQAVVRKVVRRIALALVIAILVMTGLVQRNQLDRAWPDTRQAAAYLVAHVQPGDLLLVNESWQFILYLYSSGRIHSPWDVFDVYRITNNESEIGLCQYDWFVDVQGSYKWPASIADQITACGDFRQVYTATSTVIGLGEDLRYVSYPVPIAIWQNVSEGP